MDRGTVERYRLSLFGRMVMGVAHEVDNHLSVVLGYSELLMISPNNEKKTSDNSAKIFGAGEKIGGIVRQFSRYVRPHAPVPEAFPPLDVLDGILPFSRYDLGRGNITLSVPAEAPAGAVVADKGDFALALLAVLFNGAEAMSARGGTLRVAVERDGTAWSFTVEDEGDGIPGGAMARIFEEGFTLKSADLHGGMGLPVARHLVAGMGGTVSIENLPGRGCAATIRIPGQ